MRVAVITPLKAIRTLSLSLYGSTIDKNIGLNPIGLINVNKDVKDKVK
jgi:hypothetical protein